ncbi:piggyBac transposable element-derived protein 4 [Caerostris darwini]|uniref:PiggyBac transposable element-derived protein 4 n=1 Tax=Caerostris darwini TaxID=1538125 RepID=A0AAV4TQC4_9ARAC|nr:piggyBac transposable element-derived protein 4 [Caerostris darwini]
MGEKEAFFLTKEKSKKEKYGPSLKPFKQFARTVYVLPEIGLIWFARTAIDIFFFPFLDLSSARIFTEVMSPVPCPRFKFSGIPSVHVQFDDTSDVLQFYETFIDFSLMSKILEETNKYAKQCIQSSVARQFSESKFWVETTVEELHVFFALNIL